MNMMEVFKETVNTLASPVTVFTVALACFVLFVVFPRQMTSKAVAITLLTLVLVFLAVGLTDEHFRSIVSEADNVAIVGMVFIFAFFTWYAMRKAIANDDRMDRDEPPLEKLESDDQVYVFPYLVYIEFIMALVFAIVLVVWSLLLKAPLGEPANPAISPNPSKAPWYFVGLQEMLVYYDPWIAGVLLPTFIIVGLCAIPYLDRDSSTSGFYSYKRRRLAIVPFLFGFWVLWILLILYGTFLRGPNWNFFGPFEPWTIRKVVPLLNVNLSEVIFVKWLDRDLPAHWLIREAPGLVLVIVYLTLPPLLLARSFLKGVYRKLDLVRYSVLMTLLMVMIALPLKMYLRWAFNLKYVVAIPEFFFNI